MDWTNVAVASITVVGTLGGGIVTQVFAIRSKRVDAKVQRDNRAEELRELTRKESTDEKRTVYADLNSTAHSCRAATRHYLDEKCGGRTPDLAKFEAAREALRESYSRAQMVVSDRALDFASEVNRCLDVGHRRTRRRRRPRRPPHHPESYAPRVRRDDYAPTARIRGGGRLKNNLDARFGSGALSSPRGPQRAPGPALTESRR
ncbi:hypothetical protein ACFWUP_01815 [Nocardia sp. NPDC058658]|uniref:hypothetical protein n=1 Tax=Nocardia sp. NPDC058658 TaxID=3346580 RepID=UPI003663237D